VLFGLGHYDDALPSLQEAAPLFAQLEDPESQAEIWSARPRFWSARIVRPNPPTPGGAFRPCVNGWAIREANWRR